MSSKEEFLEALRTALRDESMSERELANELEKGDGVHRHTRRVKEWVDGVRAPNRTMIKKINEVLLSDLPMPLSREGCLKLMERLGCSIKELSDLSGIALTAISDFLADRKSFDTERLWKLEDALYEKEFGKSKIVGTTSETRKKGKGRKKDKSDTTLVRPKTLKDLKEGDMIELLEGGPQRARIVKRLNDTEVVVDVWSVQNINKVERRTWTIDPPHGSRPEGQWVKKS